MEFVFGAILALVYTRVGVRRHFGICLTFAGIAAAFYLRAKSFSFIASGAQMVLINQGAFGRAATWGVSAALIVGGIVLWSPSMRSTLGKWWVVFGNASYATYLVSALCLEFAYRLFFKLAPPTSSLGYRISFLTCMVAFVMTVGFCCYLFVEKPMLRSLQKALIPKIPAARPSYVITGADVDRSRMSDSNVA